MIHFKVFLIFIGFIICSPSFADDKSLIYTVDMTKLLKLTDPGRKIISENNNSRKRLQKENDTLESELLFEEKTLSNLRKTLAVEEFRERAIAFDERVIAIRKEQARKEKILNDEIRKQEAIFFKAIYPLLYAILTDRGGVILLDQTNVVLWDSSVDITTHAIDIINRDFGNSIDNN
jgi:Skp family chaperone for outer membrane proteins